MKWEARLELRVKMGQGVQRLEKREKIVCAVRRILVGLELA